LILGLTGGYCAGKNAAAALLEERGWTCIDLDRLGHQALEANAAPVQELLGKNLRRPDGSLDRKAIGALVFADPELLSRYEAIVQPAMLRLLDDALAAGKSAGCAHRGDSVPLKKPLCINAAILYRLPHAYACEAIIEIRAPLLMRLDRSKKRDGLGFVQALLRIRRQSPLWRAGRAFSAKRAILYNKGNPQDLADKLDALLASLGLSAH